MTSPWSTHYTVAEHHDLQADTMALNIDGDIILLASARHIAVGRLSEAADSLVKLPRNHRYHTTAVEWCPTSCKKDICAITTNERVEQMVVRDGSLSLLSTLKHHTRQVTDLSWHRFEPNLLITASGDATALIWDLSDSRRPVISLTAVACVNHVRWNKVSSHLIATAHDGDLRVWDKRKGTSPIHYISAHAQKIHGIDWSETHEYQLASCSHDCSVRLFDVTKLKRADKVMATTAPVWRARYTPWGEGLVTAVIPSATSESGLLMWNVSSHSVPVHTFGGSLDVVLELQWKREGEEFQLVTLSRDQSLRIWRIEPSLQRLCSYISAENRTDNDSDVGLTNSDIAESELAIMPFPETALPAIDILESSFEVISPQHQEHNGTQSLQDEVDQLSIPAVFVEIIDPINRTLIIRTTVNAHNIRLVINFPPSYPYNAAPSFEIEESSRMDPLLKTKLLKLLKQSAQQRVRRNKTCLQACICQLVSVLELTTQVEENVPARVPSGSSPARVADAASVYSSFHDAYIPYPKSSGARFCNIGTLVCFCRPLRVTARPDPATPRSLSAATTLSFGGSFVGSYPRYPGAGSSQDASGSDLGFFLPERQMLSRALSRGNRVTKLPRTVSVYDVSKMFFVHRDLAEKYKIDLSDVAGTCSKNASNAALAGRQDLVQVWKLAELAAASDVENDRAWSTHPFSSSQIDHMIQHYAKVSDIQTAAMLSCMFPGNIAPKVDDSLKYIPTAGSSPYHTIHPADTSMEGWQIPVFKKNRSNSWSESVEEVAAAIIEHRDVVSEIQPKQMKNPLREEVKRRYGDMLHMWGLLDARTQVLKLMDEPISQLAALEFKVACQLCSIEFVKSGTRPPKCHHIILRCSYCHVLVKGISVVCMACSHGGHAAHMTGWFASETSCPTGCGCECASETNQTIEV